MKRIFFIAFIIVILLLCAGCRGRRLAQQQAAQPPVQAAQQPAAQAPAQPQAQPVQVAAETNILFQDDFQDGNPDGWVITAGWYINQNGDIYTFDTQVAGAAYVQGGGSWRDYLYSAKVRLNSGSLSLILRWSKSGRYLLQYQSDGLYLLKESSPGTFTSLVETDAPTLGQLHTFVIGCEGGHLQVAVDQVVRLDYRDTNPANQGTIGVGTLDGTDVSIDDVLISRLTQPLAQVSPTGQREPASQQPPPVVAAPPLAQAPEPEQEQAQEPEEEQPPAGPQQPVVAGQPDLTVRRLEISNTSLSSGESVRIDVTVANDGSAASGAFTTVWLPDYRSSIIGCSWDINQLAAGRERDLSCDYAGYPQAGSFRSSAFVDPEEEISESNEQNNSSTSGNIVVQQGEAPGGQFKPDLNVIGSACPGTPIKGQPFNFNMTFRNGGTADAGAFTVVLFADITTNLVGCSFDIDGMRVGASQFLNCDYAYGFTGWVTPRWVLDVENEINELDENNNTQECSKNVRE